VRRGRYWLPGRGVVMISGPTTYKTVGTLGTQPSPPQQQQIIDQQQQQQQQQQRSKRPVSETKGAGRSEEIGVKRTRWS